MVKPALLAWIFLTTGAGLEALASSRRIDLVESGRVVEMPDSPAKVTTAADELIRGADGWEAVRTDDGQFTIGVEWDAPREIAEVNIEFRHAIANREQIRAQYWQEEPPAAGAGASASDGKPRGRWLTPQAEWWAGDRDVSFAFGLYDRETADKKLPDKPTRRTTRIRFVCGKEDLPPVRYLRAYGPERVATDTFEFRFDPQAKFAPPILVEVRDGSIMAADGKTKMGSAVLRQSSGPLEIRYGLTQPDSPNATRIILSPPDKPEQQVVIHPADVARKGTLRLDEAGLSVERRGGKVTEGASRPVATVPSSFK